MNGLGLLVGHMVGDYILQNDYLAKWKSRQRWFGDTRDEPSIFRREWYRKFRPDIACTIHCLLYTFAIAIFSFWWFPWWGYLVVFFAHWPIDRFRLAKLWMVHVSGQKAFATGPLSPWSVIVVDQTFHLITLFVIGVAAKT